MAQHGVLLSRMDRSAVLNGVSTKQER
jgi:hypothetical protein